MNDLNLYTTEDGRSQIKLRAKDETVLLTQRELAQFFYVSTDNVGQHLKNPYEDGELSREATLPAAAAPSHTIQLRCPQERLDAAAFPPQGEVDA